MPSAPGSRELSRLRRLSPMSPIYSASCSLEPATMRWMAVFFVIVMELFFGLFSGVGYLGITPESFKSGARYAYSPTTTTQSRHFIFHMHSGGMLPFVKVHTPTEGTGHIRRRSSSSAIYNHTHCIVILRCLYDPSRSQFYPPISKTTSRRQTHNRKKEAHRF